MPKITDELMEYADTVAEIDPTIGGNLKAIAEKIEIKHSNRVKQAKHEMRRRLCTDMRWAVNMLEHNCSRRQLRDALEDK